jgi:hypothetical protein
LFLALLDAFRLLAILAGFSAGPRLCFVCGHHEL